jgi:hypothetical protein
MSRKGDDLCYSRTQPDFEPGLYGIKTVSTGFHPHRNTCQFLRILGVKMYDTTEKTFWSCSRFLCVSNRVKIRFKSCSNPIDQYRPGSKTLLQPIVWRTMQYTTNVNAVLHCGLMRVNAVRTGSMRLEPDQYGYHYGIPNPRKNFEHSQNFFLHRIVLSESIRNCHGLRCGSIRVEPCRYGLIRNPAVCDCIPGMQTSLLTVFTHFDPCGRASNSWFTRTGPCRPAAANIKEKLVKPCWPVSNCSDSYRPVLTLFIFRWLTFKSVYKNCI